LSGGEQQRIAIARAVVARPSLLIADEPTGNVDDAMALRLLHLFEQMNKLGTTLVIATHNAGLAAQSGRKLLHLENGELAPPPPPAKAGQIKGQAGQINEPLRVAE